MRCNEGRIDRIVRAAVIAPLALVGAVVIGFDTALGVVLAVVAGVMLITAAVGFCPLYRMFGIDTCATDAGRAPAPGH